VHAHVLIDSLGLGGAETLLADWAEGARAVGLEVSVGYLGDRTESAARLRAAGVEPELVPIRSLLGRRDRALVRDHLRAVAPDILHTHLGYADLLGGLAARATGTPSVSTVHVMDWGTGTRRERVKDRLMFLARRRTAATVITVSEAARRRYLDTGWDSPDHVVTVHNGIRDEAGAAGAGVRAELGIGADDPVVAMVAVLRRGKGHDVAAQAVRSLLPRFPDLKLLVLGDGPERPEIEAQLAVAGQAVSMAGFRDDILAVLGEVDVLIHPSRFDAFPTALLEALATATPVVATAVGGIPEIVTDGEQGILIPAPPRAEDLAAALGRLLGDRDEARRLGECGRRTFTGRFTATAWLERLLPVYEEAIARSRKEVG
jgi:glycosyltransferase involved in cell wall biosynthesis